MPTLPAFLESEIGRLPAAGCPIHVIPAPLEASVSYGGGAALGPGAILAASQQLETLDGPYAPAGRGIHTADPVDCSGPVEEVLARIETAVAASLDSGAVPVVLGGEHTVTLGALRAVRKALGPVGVVQFDAHADLRQEYEGSPLSHACVMRRALDLGLPLFQAGVRCFCQEEAELRDGLGIPRVDGPDLPLTPPAAPLLPADFPENIYVTFDVDGLDCSLMPATGTPAPGGLFWHQAMWMLSSAAKGRRIVGCDVVELAPVAGLHACDFTAAQLTYRLMGLALAAGGRDK
ncbi:agmatinase [Desulfocurvus sp. DL9XJH121]